MSTTQDAHRDSQRYAQHTVFIMAFAGLLALLDDIASILDDVATMTKVATKKTAGVIGDDLALNANQLTGSCAARELPMIAAVAKGSLLNKAILIPAALLITAVAPPLIKPLLMLGGAFLCFEGVEKVLHKIHHMERQGDALKGAPAAPATESEKVRGAIVTDFILSAEILVIALGATVGATLFVQALTLCIIGIGMTIIVYGSVALIVKADDWGISLQRLEGDGFFSVGKRKLGGIIIAAAPKLMKLLSLLGTAAMFLVGGEIIAHGLPPLERALFGLVEGVSALVPFGSRYIAATLKPALIVTFGVSVGSLCVALVAVGKRMTRVRN